MEMVKREVPLTRDDWAEAGLRALGESGLQGVAVEPLAKALGATKGSFYWHFRDRRELLEAVLDAWEHRYITDAGTRLRAIEDPRARVARLLEVGVTPEVGRIDVALTNAAAGDEMIAARVRKVQQARVDFLADCYVEMGVTRARARRLATLALVAQSGLAVLAQAAPDLVPKGADLNALHALLIPD